MPNCCIQQHWFSQGQKASFKSFSIVDNVAGEKNSFALSRNNLSSIKRPENNLPEDSGSLLCCKKRKVIKSCLGLCITKSGNARSEIVIGECDIYLNDIKNCLANAKSNKFVKSIES